ncbi:MAG: type II toxin-antitoxin system VapC family toxin [Chloroflexota bacterium]
MDDYILDTNHLSPVITPRHPLRIQILQQIRRGDRFAVGAPILTEFLYGIQTARRSRQNMTEWNQLRHSFAFYRVDEPEEEYAARLQVILKRQGVQLKTVDALIAAIALHHDLILLTTDKDFRKVPDLRQESWLTSL